MKSHGFTLVEVMICIIIVGILAAVIVPKCSEIMQEQRVKQANHKIRTKKPLDSSDKIVLINRADYYSNKLIEPLSQCWHMKDPSLRDRCIQRTIDELIPDDLVVHLGMTKTSKLAWEVKHRSVEDRLQELKIDARRREEKRQKLQEPEEKTEVEESTTNSFNDRFNWSN